LSGLITVNGQPGQFLSSFRPGGSESDGVLGAGLQWDIGPLTLGATFRSPGYKISSSALVTYESTILTAQSPSSAFMRDDTGAFQYKHPLAASLGIAARFGDVQVEADVRYHAASGTYPLYTPGKPLQVVTQDAGGATTATTQQLSPVPYGADQVFNVS